MKKILAIALALVMVLGLATSALAVSWAAPAVGGSASPFAIEVIKLGASSDVTGGRYYTVLSDAAAYDQSNVFFAIKLSVPSYSNANSYYGNSGFMSGDSVKVSVNFTNVAGKGSETYYVKLTNEAQTLWYNGSGFDATWTAALNSNCGCGDKHILSAVAMGNQEITIKASVGASGELSGIKVDGCYSVEKKTFYGVVPCVNCTPTNLSGYFFSGDCSSYGVFFTTNAGGKITAAYVADKCAAKTGYYGSVEAFNKQLFGWMPQGTYTNCTDNTCGHQAFALVELQKGDKINATASNKTYTNYGLTVGANWAGWQNDRKASGKTIEETVDLFVEWAKAAKANWESLKNDNIVSAATVTSDAYMYIYKLKDGKYERVDDFGDVRPDNMSDINSATTLTADNSTQMYIAQKTADDVKVLDELKVKSSTPTDGTLTKVLKIEGQDGEGTGVSENFFKPDTGDTSFNLVYGIDDARILKKVSLGKRYLNTDYVEYGKINYVTKAGSDWRLFKQTSATTVNCDSNEAAYLNALNHVYALLGFTYADWAAGNVYMNDDLLLTNFGFTASVSDSKTWGAYTAAITVATVAEVPATGSVTYVGFAMIVLAIAAAVVTKKVRA